MSIKRNDLRELQPYDEAFAITPSDVAALRATTNAIYVGGNGNLRVMMGNGAIVTFTGVLVGTVYQLRVTRVYQTGTTATGIVGLL